jgi:hypothetical protein
LLSAKDVGPAGTEVIDIDVSKPISQIDIKFITTKSQGGMTAPGPANITKIELVSGSTPFHQLSGYQNQALAYYNRPGRIMEHGQHISGSSETDLYTIDFGRWLWDEALAFDPLRFTNPQLKISYDEDVADDGATANELEVRAHVFDEKSISPIGFLAALEHFSYGCGANNSYETIDLPEDRLIRQMLVRAFTDAFEPWYTIKEARLDEGTLDRIPWEYTDLEQYYRRMKAVWPMIQTALVGISDSGGQTFYVPQTDFWANILVTPHGQTPDIYHASSSMRGGKASLVSAQNSQFGGLATGWLPWHTFQFPMGLPSQIEDWYDPMGKKPRLRLRAGTSGTSGVGQVVLEELYRY